MEAFNLWFINEWNNTRDTFISGFDEATDYAQWGAIILAFLLAWPISIFVGKTIMCPDKGFRKTCERFFGLTNSISGYPIYVALVAWLASGIAVLCDFPHPILDRFAFIASAYAIYALSRRLIKGAFVPRMISFLVFASVILELLGKRESFLQLLKSNPITIGSLPINLYEVLAGLVSLTVLLWLAGLVATAATRSLQKRSNIAPSTRVLLGKIFRVIGYTIAILIALQIADFDLKHLAIFSGALGIGLGFGLQKVLSNFISGIILLMDKSIKPGDVIEMDETFGWINSIRSRYVSVITRDRKEHLIPNEDLITNRVINWSFSDTFIRIKADFGVSYNSDPHKVRELCLETIKDIPRILEFPEPVCLLTGFGDSSVDLQLRFWINDPKEGVGNIKSMALFAIWDTLKRNGIEIPFPQRDLHLKSISPDSAAALRGGESHKKSPPLKSSEGDLNEGL